MTSEVENAKKRKPLADVTTTTKPSKEFALQSGRTTKNKPMSTPVDDLGQVFPK